MSKLEATVSRTAGKPMLSPTDEWLRDHLNKTLGWGLAAFLLVCGWALSSGHKIGFREPWDNPAKVCGSLAKQDDIMAAIALSSLVPGALLLWTRRVLQLVRGLRMKSKERRHETLLTKNQVVAFASCVWIATLVVTAIVVFF